MLSKIQYEILSLLDTEYCYSFDYLIGYHPEWTKPQLSKEFKLLREMGLVEFNRGLLNDDGEAAGSGYCLLYGSTAQEKRNKLIEEYNLKNK